MPAGPPLAGLTRPVPLNADSRRLLGCPAPFAVRAADFHAFRVQIKGVLRNFEPAFARYRNLSLFDPRVIKFLDTPALQTDEVVVVVALVQFEHGLAGFEMMTDEEACTLELGQHAVYGGEADVRTIGQQLSINVLCGEMSHVR